jgi:hypothetical protein
MTLEVPLDTARSILLLSSFCAIRGTCRFVVSEFPVLLALLGRKTSDSSGHDVAPLLDLTRHGWLLCS